MSSPHPTGDRIGEPADAARAVRESIDVAAPAADVFRALAEPRELAAWLGGEPAPDPAGASDASHGALPDLPASRWSARVVAPDGTAGVVDGEYGYMAPPRVLETSWRASWNDFAVERVRFELVPIDVGGVAGTRVTVTHTRAVARLRAPSSAFAGAAAHGDLWPTFLARLAAHVVTVAALARWGTPGDPSSDAFAALHRAVVDLHHAH